MFGKDKEEVLVVFVVIVLEHVLVINLFRAKFLKHVDFLLRLKSDIRAIFRRLGDLLDCHLEAMLF